MRLRGFLNAPVGMHDVVIISIRTLFHLVLRNRFGVVDVTKEAELTRVENKVVVILEGLVQQEGKQLLAKRVLAAAVVANVQDQAAGVAGMHLIKRVAEELFERFCSSRTRLAEAMD